MHHHKIVILPIAALLVVPSTINSADRGFPIAGIEPSVRPRGAPVIEQVNKDAVWYQRALTGVAKPYPYSLRFMEDQGNWYTPFNHPGMLVRYDIRGWHSR